ncbi:MAG: methyltransferase [Blastocatellia bacterium]
MSEQMNPEVPPSGQMMQLMFGFIPTLAVFTAARIGVADQLKNGPQSIEALAVATGMHAGSLRRLLRATASVGVFSETSPGVFSQTPMSATLCEDATDSLRSFALFWGADWHLQVWAALYDSVRLGQPAFEQIHGQPIFAWFEEHRAEAAVFNNAMTSLSKSSGVAVTQGYDFTGVGKLVDIGGGHGFMLATIMEKYPEMQGVLYDAPSVIAGASDFMNNAALAGRAEAVAGDFFVSAPAGGDAYIMKHIIHDWNDEDSLKILRHCHEGMTPDGRLLVVEMVVPEGDVPAPAKFLDLEMLSFLHSFERTEAEYRELFARAGFELTRIVPTPSPYSVIEGRRKQS